MLVFHDSLDILFAGAYAAQVQYETPAAQAPPPASPDTPSSPTFSRHSSPGEERKEQASSGAAGVSQPGDGHVAEEQPPADGSGAPALGDLEAAAASAATGPTPPEDPAESSNDDFRSLRGVNGILGLMTPNTPLPYTRCSLRSALTKMRSSAAAT